MPTDIDQLNPLRFLCVDMVQKAGSGHPGTRAATQIGAAL